MKRLASLMIPIILSATPAYADAVYKLKSEIEISTPTITLADLIDGPDIPADPLYGAPQPGKSGTIQVTRIASAFRSATGHTLPLSSEIEVLVKRRARLIAEADLTQDLHRIFERDFKITDPEVKLQLDKDGTGLAVSDQSTGAILISNVKLDPKTLRFEAEVSTADAPSLNIQPLPISGFVAADRLVPVLIRAIDKGQPVTEADIRMERRLRSVLIDKSVLQPTDLQNRVALSALSPGNIVTDDLVGRARLVEKGAFVTAIFEADGLLLSMRGRAIDSGAAGDVVSFTNLQSKKTLYGVVTRSGTVRVSQLLSREARLTSQNSANSD